MRRPDVLPASATAEAKSEARTRFVKALSEYEERTKAGSAGRLWVQGCEAADYHRHQHSREEEASHESEEGDYEVVWLYTKFKLLTAAVLGCCALFRRGRPGQAGAGGLKTAQEEEHSA